MNAKSLDLTFRRRNFQTFSVTTSYMVHLSHYIIFQLKNFRNKVAKSENGE